MAHFQDGYLSAIERGYTEKRYDEIAKYKIL